MKETTSISGSKKPKKRMVVNNFYYIVKEWLDVMIRQYKIKGVNPDKTPETQVTILKNKDIVMVWQSQWFLNHSKL